MVRRSDQFFGHTGLRDQQQARIRDGDGVYTGSITKKNSCYATLVAMVQARVLTAQDGYLMSQGDEFEL
jgi:hypothetical protein